MHIDIKVNFIGYLKKNLIFEQYYSATVTLKTW